MLEPSFRPATSEIESPKIPPPSQTSIADFTAGVSPDSSETREGELSQTGATPDASLEQLLQQINVALQAGDPAARDRLRTLLTDLVRSHPDAAGRFAESLEAGEVREAALRQVAQLWTAADPARAESWAAQLSNESERASALSDMCFQIAQTNAAQALFKADQYGLGTSPGTIRQNLVQQWADQDFDSAAGWVKQQPAGEQRDQMLSRLAFVQSKTAPVEAVQMVLAQIPSGETQTEAAISILHQWALRDLHGAQSWVELFPAGPLRDRADTELDGIAAYQNSDH